MLKEADVISFKTQTIVTAKSVRNFHKIIRFVSKKRFFGIRMIIYIVNTKKQAVSFQYNPETKRQSMHWETHISQRMNKVKTERIADCFFFASEGYMIRSSNEGHGKS